MLLPGRGGPSFRR